MAIIHSTHIPIPHEFDNDLLGYGESLGHGEFHFKLDAATGLRAIVAIHSTLRGPSIGGCRCIEYDNVGDALYDALRLSQGMSYKSAITDLPYGGGKTVLMKPKKIRDREAYFAACGRFINDLGGRYITGMDSGTQIADMEVIARYTSYVTGAGDPALFTAKGVLLGIQAALNFQRGRNTLSGVHVAIQGVGNVGYSLARQLHEAGATLTISDIDLESAQRCAIETGAKIVASGEIYAVDCDVFSPCALGAIINNKTLPLIRASIIAGSANNQLAEPVHGRLLQEKNILYAPDYVINAGGLVHAVAEYENRMGSSTKVDVDAKINGIYDTLMAIFEQAVRDNTATGDVADAMAAEKLRV